LRHRPFSRKLRRIGLGDFAWALDARGLSPRQQSACQMEAPSLRRTPILHLVASNATSKSANRSKADLRLNQRHDATPRPEVL
jgi:hypothetical protein